MSQFDKVYKELVETVLNKGTMSTGKVRTKYADGTPAHYISYIGYQFRLDNSTDEAHLITSRYAPYKSAIREIYWIWKLRSNNVEELEKLGCRFWREWARKDINNIDLVYVSPRTCHDLSKPIYKVNEIIDSSAPLQHGEYGDYYILDEYKEKDTYYQTIQFKDTGYIKKKYKHHRETKDPYRISVFNIGCYGECCRPDLVEYFGAYHRRWIRKWENIVRRVAGRADRNAWYIDTKLGYDFQCCEKFLEWVIKNNSWGKDHLHDLDVDKDYYLSNCYSGETCVLLPHVMNSRLNSYYWYLMDGFYFFSLSDLGKYLYKKGYNVCLPSGRVDVRRVNRVIPTLMTQLVLEKIDHRRPNPTNGMYPRFRPSPLLNIGDSYGAALNTPTAGFSNQVDYVINEIKNNPNSRRIITEIWIPEKLHNMVLYPCAHLVQYNVIGNKLYMDVRQRSCDIALGLVANVFQYSVLHKLIAKECGLEPADLIWTISNAHIYDRHIEDLKKQIELPTLSGFKLDLSKVDSFNSWTNPDDITVPNYAEVVTNKIKYEVAI